MVTEMETKNNIEKESEKHMDAGTASLILGIIGIIGYLTVGLIVGLPLGIIAVILGISARKQGDKYGNYGVIIGAILIALGILTLIAAIVYIYVSSMLPPI